MRNRRQRKLSRRACDPTNWELDNHPAYEDLDSTMRDFLRNRYKYWAPKVSWVWV